MKHVPSLLFSPSLAILTVLIGCSSATAPNPPPKKELLLEATPQQITAAGNITLKATPKNLGQVQKVAFYQDQTLLGTDTTAPYELQEALNTPDQNGTRTYTARAYEGSSETLSNAVEVRVNLPRPSVFPLVTFVTDDGSKQDFQKLLPIFKSKNVPAVAAIVTAFVSKDSWHMNQQEMLALQDAGWELASHTRTHPNLNPLTDPELLQEIHNSKLELELLGGKVSTLVYPYASASEKVQMLAAKDYTAALNPSGGINTLPLSNMALQRVAFGAFTPANSLSDYKAQVDAAFNQQGWLIFMLHPFAPDFDLAQEQHLRDTIDYIKGKNIPIVTVKQAMDLIGKK